MIKDVMAAGSVYLGRQGENLAYRAVFDVRKWREQYGEGGTFSLVHLPFDSDEPYPAAVTEEDGYVYWPITSADNASPGDGVCELRYSINGTKVKSQFIQTTVDKALGETDEPPEEYQGWVDTVLDAAETVYEAVEHYREIEIEQRVAALEAALDALLEVRSED